MVNLHTPPLPLTVEPGGDFSGAGQEFNFTRVKRAQPPSTFSFRANDRCRIRVLFLKQGGHDDSGDNGESVGGITNERAVVEEPALP